MPELAFTPRDAARAFDAAHPELPNAAGVDALLANRAYVETLARLVYHWGFPAVDAHGRTSCWEVMKASGPGATLGLFPGAPKNHMGYLDDYMPPGQRKVVTPNNDTIYGVGFADLAADSVVVQTPTDAPAGHYWTVQIADLFTNVVHQLGSASRTPGGKHLLVGPGWEGPLPEGFISLLRCPTQIAGVFGRSFTAHSPESKAQARSVLNQIGMWPLAEDTPGPRRFDCEAVARNHVFPPGVTAAQVAADPDMLRVRPVDPHHFWDQLALALAASPDMAPADQPMGWQARVLLALREQSADWRALIDQAALAADGDLRAGARYQQTGARVANGWQRQHNGGVWGADWFGRAQAAAIYIYVNDVREAMYLIRGTDSDGHLLHGRYDYRMRFGKDGLPPVQRERGGFWSLTMYDADYYMLPDSPNGRTNLGTVNLDANELHFDDDGSLSLWLGSRQPTDPAARANWLPAPDGQFALLVRAYVPGAALQDDCYALPDVVRQPPR